MMFVKKLLAIAIAVFMLTFCYINLSSHWPALLNSYENSFTQPQVRNVIFNQKLHKDGRNIFFHETSKTVDGMIKVNSRQACAIESAGTVYDNLLFCECLKLDVLINSSKSKSGA